MKVKETALPGVLLIEPDVYGDARGFFFEVFHSRRYRSFGIAAHVDGGGPVQLNHSRSVRNTVRGMHFQEPRAQGKLVWTVKGCVFDVAVDIRRGSPTFGRWVGVELDAGEHNQLWIPPGFAHGFCVLTDTADCMYACTELYAPECEHAIAWDDPDLGIDWPVEAPILSAKDQNAPRLRDAPVLPDYRTE